MHKTTFQGLVLTALKGSTQAQLAERLGCTQQAVSGYAAGLKVPPRSWAKRYAPALNVEPEVLAKITEAARKKAARRRAVQVEAR